MPDLVVEVDHVVLDGDVAVHVLHFSMNDDDNLYDDWMTKWQNVTMTGRQDR